MMEDNRSPPPMQVIREPFLMRNPWFSVFMVLIFYFLFQNIPIIVYYLFVSPSFVGANPYINRIIEFISLGILLLLFIPLFRIPKDNHTLKQYYKDVQLTNFNGKAILVGFLLAFVVFVLGYLSTYLSAVLSKLFLVGVQGQYISDTPRVIWDPSYLFDPNVQGLNVYYALTPGIMEELTFRGIILGLLMKKYQWKKAVIIDGIVFGLFHLINLISPIIGYFRGTNAGDLQYLLNSVLSTSFQVIYAGSMGIVWALIFVKSKSILPCILGHWLIDAFGGLFLSPNIGVLWIYLICTTLFGVGILPAILDIKFINIIYKTPPWNEKLKENIVH
jgi:membrane protease YdiL (CAAX protease family)